MIGNLNKTPMDKEKQLREAADKIYPMGDDIDRLQHITFINAVKSESAKVYWDKTESEKLNGMYTTVKQLQHSQEQLNEANLEISRLKKELELKDNKLKNAVKIIEKADFIMNNAANMCESPTLKKNILSTVSYLKIKKFLQSINRQKA